MSILLEINDIKKSYGTFQALKGVSLTLYKGEIVSLLGVNGAGKTTLSTIVATLHPPTSGDIFYKNSSIYTAITAYRSILGYCPQKPNLHNLLTLKENLESAGRYFGLDAHTSNLRINELADQLHLHDYLHFKPHMLSGGYKQRFLIARSLMHKPELLLLDEPTVALDPHVRRQLWDYIKYLKQTGTTVLLTTHYLDEAEYLSDRVCVLDKGLVRLIDTPSNLLASYSKGRLEDVFIQLMNEGHTV